MAETNEIYYPELLTNSEAFPANIMFTFYERSSTISSSVKDIVHLYMPENFGQPNTISWDHQFSGGQAVLGALAGGVDAIKDGLLGSRMAGLTEWMGKALGSVGKYTAPASDLALLKAGVTLNPYITQLFRGVDLRNFQFAFRLTPFSERDCYTIYNIINIFRKWSLPSGPKRRSKFFLYELPRRSRDSISMGRSEKITFCTVLNDLLLLN